MLPSSRPSSRPRRPWQQSGSSQPGFKSRQLDQAGRLCHPWMSLINFLSKPSVLLWVILINGLYRSQVLMDDPTPHLNVVVPSAFTLMNPMTVSWTLSKAPPASGPPVVPKRYTAEPRTSVKHCTGVEIHNPYKIMLSQRWNRLGYSS